MTYLPSRVLIRIEDIHRYRWFSLTEEKKKNYAHACIMLKMKPNNMATRRRSPIKRQIFWIKWFCCRHSGAFWFEEDKNLNVIEYFILAEQTIQWIYGKNWILMTQTLEINWCKICGVYTAGVVLNFHFK